MTKTDQIKAFLAQPTAAQLSNCQIARQFGVSEGLVRKIRSGLKGTSTSYPQTRLQTICVLNPKTVLFELTLDGTPSTLTGIIAAVLVDWQTAQVAAVLINWDEGQVQMPLKRVMIIDDGAKHNA